MSLLNILSTPFPHFLFTCNLTDSTDFLTDANDKIKLTTRSASLGMDCLAIWQVRSQTQVMSPSSASVSVASIRRSIFRPETSVSRSSSTLRSPLLRTLIYLNIPEHQAAERKYGSKLSPLGSLGTSLTKVGSDSDSLPSRTSIKEICADIDQETVVSSTPKEKRDRGQNVVQTLRDR